MHWLEMAIELCAQFFLDLAGICLNKNEERPRTVIGWLVFLFALSVIAGIIIFIVRSLFFSK
jgi:hypothetical protein